MSELSKVKEQMNEDELKWLDELMGALDKAFKECGLEEVNNEEKEVCDECWEQDETGDELMDFEGLDVCRDCFSLLYDADDPGHHLS